MVLIRGLMLGRLGVAWCVTASAHGCVEIFVLGLLPKRSVCSLLRVMLLARKVRTLKPCLAVVATLLSLCTTAHHVDI